MDSAAAYSYERVSTASAFGQVDDSGLSPRRAGSFSGSEGSISPGAGSSVRRFQSMDNVTDALLCAQKDEVLQEDMSTIGGDTGGKGGWCYNVRKGLSSIGETIADFFVSIWDGLCEFFGDIWDDLCAIGAKVQSCFRGESDGGSPRSSSPVSFTNGTDSFDSERDDQIVHRREVREDDTGTADTFLHVDRLPPVPSAFSLLDDQEEGEGTAALRREVNAGQRSERSVLDDDWGGSDDDMVAFLALPPLRRQATFGDKDAF